MRIQNLPALDGRYWVVMLAASLLGTALGDFLSNDLDLGFLGGLLPLGLVLTAILLAEGRARAASEFYYWGAIVTTRAMATNLADLATHGLKLDYVWVAMALAALLVATLALGRPRASPASNFRNILPATNDRYWIAILIASTMGTVAADFVADGLGLGAGLASVLMGSISFLFIFQIGAIHLPGKAEYWVALLLVRTTGTVTADFLSGKDGLGIGLMWSAAILAGLLVALLCFSRSAVATALPDVNPDRCLE